MLQFSKSTCSAVLAASVSLSISAPAAFADVTNAEVWGNYRAYMEGLGYTVSATESVNGNTLALSEIVLTIPPVDGKDAGTASISPMSMTELGDGTVRITLPPKSSMAINMAPAGSEAVNVTIDLTQDGFSSIVSGDTSKMDYTYSADTLTASLASLTVDGVSLDAETAQGGFSLSGLSGKGSISSGNPRTAQQSATVGAITYTANFSDPDTDAKIKLDGGMQNLTSSSTSVIPSSDSGMQDMSAMIAAGFAAEGTVAYQAGNLDMSLDGPDGPGTMQTTSSGGTLSFAMSANGLSYDVGQTDLAVNALLPQVPLPIVLNMAQSKLNFAMPLQKSDEEQDFAFGFTMGDFTVSDMLWSMVDPTGQLPHDPATLALDLSGKSKVLFDFFDPAQTAALQQSGATPGELNALTLNNLIVDVAGARLTGTGDFTFDNADMATFDGMPRPEGTLFLQLIGGNGLMDKLVNMGLLPEQQAMGARMMMGMFTVPGEGPDTIKSEIEVNDQGHILANGQRIK